ncbi:MAG TPA: PBP1A family penicillin-binding protein [Patescibacteria group bacterium]|nr:PBP1A family penicillin-binding protein [Patescibacteria group bacterium]
MARYALFGIIGFFIFFFLYFLWVSRDLPTPGKLAGGNIKDSTKILDKNGVVLYSIYKDYNRLYVPLNQIPDNLKKATIATEDKDFYTNNGFSVTGLIRGLLLDPILKSRASGGSTITQQLVKNVLLSPERSVTRKLKELILAIQVDQRFSKDQILEMYLNNVPYGGTAVGVEAASNLYFGKHAKELDLAQSAFLAGLPQLPSVYSPYANPGSKAYEGRTQEVLGRMIAEHEITQKQADAAMKEVKGFTFSQKQGSLKAPHFVQYVRQELAKLYGEAVVESGNLTVETTLDYEIQKDSEDIVNSEVAKLKNYDVGNGAAVVMDPKTGGILAMVGSHDYFDTKGEGNFNAATALRQPGSSLKPIMYATAFEKGYTPATMIMDLKTEFPTNVPGQEPYSPANYDGKFRGPVQLRFALGNSLNVPAVKMLARVGIKPVMQKAYDMGIDNWKPTDQNLASVGLSLVLGGREATLLQIVNAYSVFADQGIKQEPYAISKVIDGNGKVIYEHKPSNGTRVLSPEVSYLISHILLDDNARSDAFGRGSLLNIPGKTVSVKTGTTDSKRDNWAIGYTPSYVVGVWVGNNDNTPMNPKIASGITGATPIWHNIMAAILKGKKDEQPKKPDGVVAVQIDAFSGGTPRDGQPTRTEYFMKGTEPTTNSVIYKKVKLSKHQDGKLANSDEIQHGDYDVKEYIVFHEDDPVSTDGKNRWQDAIDAWLNETHKDDSTYRPPTDTSDYKYDQNNNNSPTNTPTPTPTGGSTPTPSPTGILPTL